MWWSVLSYCQVTWWVKAFREGRDAVQDNLHTGRYHVDKNTVHLLASPWNSDRRWTANEVAAEVGVCHKTVLHILHDILGYRKLAARWIPHEISEMQQCHPMQSHRPRWTDTKGKVTTFLDESSLWTKRGLAHTNQTWNTNQMNGSIPVLLDQRKWALHNVLWRWCSLWCMALMR